VHGYEVPDFPGQPQVSTSPVFARYTELVESAFAFHASVTGSSTSVAPVLTTPKLAAHSVAPVPVPQFGDGGVRMQWGMPIPGQATAAVPTIAGTSVADYVLPLATRCRSLFTMDFAEAVYISELRSTPAGHWSYRNVAWQMFREVARAYPSLAKHFRIRDPHEPVDLLQR
jgi:hypothetical protein